MAYRVDPGRAPECFEYEVVDPDTQTLVKMRQGFMLASEGVTIPSTVTITGDYTVKATDRSILVNTSAAVTITLPADLPIGTPLGITRIVSSANAITVARSGSELIEGAATFVTHGAWAAATLNLAEVVLKKIDATNWRFVGGEISGSNVYGFYKKKPDGSAWLNLAGQSVALTAYGSQYRGIATAIPFPLTLASVDSVSPFPRQGVASNTYGFWYYPISDSLSSLRLNVYSDVAQTVTHGAVITGRWRA